MFSRLGEKDAKGANTAPLRAGQACLRRGQYGPTSGWAGLEEVLCCCFCLPLQDIVQRPKFNASSSWPLLFLPVPAGKFVEAQILGLFVFEEIKSGWNLDFPILGKSSPHGLDLGTYI